MNDTTRRYGTTLAIAAAAILAPALAMAPAPSATATPSTTEVVWLLPETVTSMPTGNTPEIWHQTYLPDGVVPCGRHGQADVYPTSAVPGLIADGILHEGEDYQVVLSWRFLYGGDCPPPEPVKLPASLDHADFCGPEYALNVPASDGLVRYDTDLTGLVDGDGVAIVTATAMTDRLLTIDGTNTATTLTWQYSFTNEPCPVEEPPVVPPVEAFPPALPLDPGLPTLPVTGPSDLLPLGLAAAGLLTVAGTIITRRIRRFI